jgi:uncharacterized protein YndB with AHSA1/START domain
MSDFLDQIDLVHRETGERDGHTLVALTKRYDAQPADVWDALTAPERIQRWFLPVSGEFKVGGRYQLAGNAGGEILACEPPTRLKLTWESGETTFSEVEVLLSADGDGTELRLEHASDINPEFWTRFGPGATGVGYEMGLLSLTLHLRGETMSDTQDPMVWMASPEGVEFTTRCAQGWGAAHRAAGVPAEEADPAMHNVIGAYVPQP